MMLNRNIGLLDVFCVAFGAMVSSGIFVLPGLAHAEAGPAVVFSYLLAGLLAGCGVLSVAEIITAMPKAGGDYFYVTRTLGPAAGTVTGLLIWFSLSLKSSFALVGLTAFAQAFLDLPVLATGLGVCLFFLGANLFGLKEATRVQNLLVLFLLCIMGGYVALGVGEVQPSNFLPFAPFGWHAVLATTGMVFVSYGGLLAVASVAEEVKDPGRILPQALLLSLAAATVVYVAAVFVTTGLLPSDQLDNSLQPLTDGAGTLLGPTGAAALSLAAVLAFISTVNSGLMAASRYLLALARDNSIPSIFGRTIKRTQAPVVSLAFTAGIIAASLLAPLELLVKTASAVLIVTNILAGLCVMVLRESRLMNYRPVFRAPLYPVPQLIGILGALLLLLEMGGQALMIALGLVLAGLFFYWFYGRIKSVREYALLHLMERMLDKELAKGHLEKELKEIVRDRDSMDWDLFDEVVGRAKVVDLSRQCPRSDAYSMIADEIAPRTSLGEEELERLFKAREERGLDLVAPGVAMADVLLPGKGGLELVIVRNSCPMVFPGGEVSAFFGLLVSQDNRYAYVPVVAALAQILMDADFLNKWLAAKDDQGLKDLLHLGERRRVTPNLP